MKWISRKIPVRPPPYHSPHPPPQNNQNVPLNWDLEASVRFVYLVTVEPRYNDPRYNDIPGITIDMLCPGKSYSKMYGTEPRYNDLRYNDIPDITMSF